MRKEVIAPVLVLMMLIAAGGYMMLNTDQNGQNNPDAGDDGTDGNNQISDEWDVYYVQSGSDLPACGSSTLGRLYYVADTAGFETCTTEGWQFVNLTGPAGADGVAGTNGSDGSDGAQGPAGLDGADGADGTPGASGADGHSALAVTTTEPAGQNCADGGIRIDIGVDDDDDRALSPIEVDLTQYVCNGADGNQGQPGTNGTDGQDGSNGIDGVDGTNGTDGQDGANGIAGQDGTNGSASASTMLTSISSPSPNLACTSGGRVMQQGLDNGDNGGISQNGILEFGEVDYTTTYCSAFKVSRMTDLNPGSGSGSADDITVMGTRLYFEANDGTNGYELWAHETNNGSTWQVADIRSGSLSGNPNDITVMGTRLYFEASDGNQGKELWMMEIEHTITYS